MYRLHASSLTLSKKALHNIVNLRCRILLNTERNLHDSQPKNIPITAGNQKFVANTKYLSRKLKKRNKINYDYH